MSNQISSLLKITLFCITIKMKFKITIMLPKPDMIWHLLLFQQTCEVSIYSQCSVHIGCERLFFLILQSPVPCPCNVTKVARQLPHVLDLDFVMWLPFVCDACKDLKQACKVWSGLSEPCDPLWATGDSVTPSAWTPEDLVGESWTCSDFWHQAHVPHEPE